MAWSKLQEAIFSWVDAHANRKGAVTIEAVAGSGKTTTIVEAAKRIPTTQRAVFLAFNKSIATELQSRLPSTVEAKTLNSLGHGAVYRALGKVTLDTNKTRAIVEALIDKDEPNRFERMRDICSLVAKAKSHALVPPGKGYTGYDATLDRWAELADRYDVDADAETFKLAGIVLEQGLSAKHVIDFDDQLYFVVAMDLKVSKYDWIIVDEAQDVSHVQRMMLQKFLKSNGRLIAVGDSRQAIYGFRGADSDSMANLRKVFRADTLPLSITYRCPKSVVALAQQYVPGLEAAETAADGRVEHLDKLDAADLQASDLVVCRYTAPIIKTAYAMIGRKLPVRVQGRDIGSGLIAVIKKVCGKSWESMPTAELMRKLEAWLAREAHKALEKGDEAKADSLNDKFQSIAAVVDGSEALTGGDVAREIESLFAGGTGVLMSTVHRAKGLEAERVYVLDPECMPAKRAKQEWQLAQEYNLMYVAYTRAKSELYFVSSKAVA